MLAEPVDDEDKDEDKDEDEDVPCKGYYCPT
jgi:hypothetical protein